MNHAADGDQFGAASEMRRTWSGLYVPKTASGSSAPMLRVWEPSDFEAQLQNLNYFRDNPDVRAIFEFRKTGTPTPGGTLDPGVTRLGNTDYWLVHPFCDGQLLVHSPSAARAGFYNFQIKHSVLFDSNVLDRIVRLIDTPASLSTNDVYQARALIRWIVTRRYDFQLYPYLLESFSKNEPSIAYAHACRAHRALLQLHLMDRTYFESTGQIRADKALLEEREHLAGTSDLDELTELDLKQFKNLKGPLSPPSLVTVWQICIIKMILIRRCDLAGKSLDRQWEALDDFLFREFDAFVTSIRNFGALYFAGALDHWVGTQRTSKPDAALQKITNCAWDLFLGGMPVDILGNSPDDFVVLSNFCTREAALAQLLGIAQVLLVVCRDKQFSPYFSFDLDILRVAIGRDADRSLRRADDRARAYGEKRQGAHHMQVDLHALLEAMRAELFRKIGAGSR